MRSPVMKRPSQMGSVEEIEADLDRCLRELRHTDATNLPAKAALEYRIGRLRQRREALR